MVTETDRHLSDNNNNNAYPTRSLSKDTDNNDDDGDVKCDETDEENIDVGVESDVDERVSDVESTDDNERLGTHRIHDYSDSRTTCITGPDSPVLIQQSPDFHAHNGRSPSTTLKHNNQPSHQHISKLSFGIDRILNNENKNTKRSSEFRDSPKQFLADDRHLSLTHRVNNEPSSRLTPVNCLPSKMLPAVELMSPLSPFHGPLLPPDMCRVEHSSLDILPVRPVWPDVYVCPWTGVQRDRFGLVRRVGHPYQNRTPPKRKKPRTAFSRQQVLELEKRFTRQKYLASAERSALAKTLSMTDAQVKTWFQNRRTKWRRQTAEEREIERQAAHKFLLSLRPEDPNNRPGLAYGALCGVAQPGSHPATEIPPSPGAPSVN